MEVQLAATRIILAEDELAKSSKAFEEAAAKVQEVADNIKRYNKLKSIKEDLLEQDDADFMRTADFGRWTKQLPDLVKEKAKTNLAKIKDNNDVLTAKLAHKTAKTKLAGAKVPKAIRVDCVSGYDDLVALKPLPEKQIKRLIKESYDIY